MDYKRTLDYLYSLESPEIKLGLHRIQDILDEIGNPEKQLKSIHVAGTNGKGSVCSMIFYSLKEAGYTTGLYTSPHLKKFNQRIIVSGKQITDEEIVDYFIRLKPHIKNQSFFEITTAIALLHFKEKNVDFAVLEVGLGGRLDATNIITPLVSVITNVGLEHTELLGKKIEKIAFEKGGIIKQNVPVVTGVKGKALTVIKKISKERNAQLFLAKKHPGVKFKYLNGEFQQQNKDIALTAIDVLKKYHDIKISEKLVVEGIKKTKWPGRLHFISGNILADCAHNPSGFDVLLRELKAIKKQKNIKNFIFIVGTQNDKDRLTMLNIMTPLISAIIFTKSKNEKATEPQELLRTFNEINHNASIKTKIIKNPKRALAYAKKISGKKDLVVAAGSIYMIGELI